MVMNICCNCKHWDRRTELEEEGECTGDLIIYGECRGNSLTMGYPDGDQIVPGIEEETGEMEFLTGPEFGCIKWTAK